MQSIQKSPLDRLDGNVHPLERPNHGAPAVGEQGRDQVV
jgi:hypothetical protein